MAYSNFLIDTSKKARLIASGNGKTELGAALLKGDIDPKALKQVGFSYKEEFEEGSNVLDGAFNKYSTQLKSIIDGILTDSLKGKISSTLGSTENADLKARITTLMAFAMQANPTKDMTDAKMAEILEGFNLALRYRLPYRKAMPAFQQSGNSFSIQFAYGKCNLFNAEKEVWEPVRTIKDKLFPKVDAVPNHNGLIKIGGTSGVPYTQQSLWHVVRGVGQLTEEDGWGITRFGREIGRAAKELLNTTDEEQAVQEAETYLSQIEKDLRVEGAGNEKDTRKEAFSKLKKFVNQVNPDNKNLKEMWKNAGSPGATGWFKSNDFNEDNNSIAPLVRNAWDDWRTTFLADKNLTLMDKGNNGDIHAFAVSKKEETVGEVVGESFLDILKHVVNYQMYVEGAAAEVTYQNLIKDASLFYLYYGFPQEYKHSQEEVEQYCSVASNAGIKLGPFLPEEVEILYDWEHLDDSGCPMAATVNFKKIFAIAPYGQGLLLKGEGGSLLGLE